ncbi:NADPH-dependent glutamate synthase [Thermosyntropha sp.]|uniref:NADPH-dependent glutamate synthase n=1 Tax=Thermosyntropha sp. TaxID=2740820 RepID=UPI0025DE388A|nr:NADPH-dependent glutamate synthase [Thermosyntropha sp.]MBO8159117.1 NADPH-dependent glutamate synthase [Thermosyntropha sp.]
MPREIIKNKYPMPLLPIEKRIKSFHEVALGYTEDLAIKEAERCLQCNKPSCVEGCPVGVDIPAFIKLILERDYLAAAAKIKEKNSLPAVCGRVCPQENQCEKMCVLGKKYEPVAIGRLERFVADYELANGELQYTRKSPTGYRVAVVGSGPAGLTCAAELAKMGHEVTVFEALHIAGGVLVYGIPEFRLPKSIVAKEIENIKALGVKIEVNSVIGKLWTVDELMREKGYHAVFIGTGAGLPYFMDIPGENLNGVYSANEFLTRVNLMKAYDFPNYLTPIRTGKRVAVIGGGNVAMDAARTALRLGVEESYIIYRRTEKEMPARAEEIEHAKEEGVRFIFLSCPVEIKGDNEGRVCEIICQNYELGEPDESGRRRPVPIPGSEYSLKVDTVIMAIGQGPNPLIAATTDQLQVNKKGNIIADEQTGKTSKPGVFAGGDIVSGAATVILAMGAGKKAALSIDKYLRSL